jgi:hypothetical protein
MRFVDADSLFTNSKHTVPKPKHIKFQISNFEIKIINFTISNSISEPPKIYFFT